MIIFKLLANVLILFIGIIDIVATTRNIKSGRYPLWVSIFDIISDVCISLSSFTVWLIN